MTSAQFEQGYWYASDIKAFARELGIANVSRYRKDELELAIQQFLKTGKVITPRRNTATQKEVKDVQKGLKLSLPVIHYTNDSQTKDFLIKEARKMDPDFKVKSGSRYRLNRWREEQIANKVPITYADLVAHFVELSRVQKYKKIPVGRYINFLADFLSKEKGSNRQQAIAAWHKLKKMPVEKTYAAWRRQQDKA